MPKASVPMNNPAHRTAANWMAKQPPLSPTRNPREISGRMGTGGGMGGGDNLLNSQQSSLSRGDHGRIRAFHSPEGGMTDSAIEFQ